MLAVAALVVAVELMTREALRLVMSEDGRLTVLGAVATVLTVLLAVGAFAFTAACTLAVVRDTANGCDRIVNWPGLAFMEWAGDALIVANGIGIATAASVGGGWALRQCGWRDDATVVAGAVVVFVAVPIVLLSLLENESVIDVVSPPVWRTFVLAAGGWTRFYLASGMIVAAAGLLVATVLASGSVWVLVGASLAWSVAWFIYFRMLGCLAWYGTERSVAAAREAGQPDDREDDPGDDPLSLDDD